jgi:opacity protein-like surface antigen
MPPFETVRRSTLALGTALLGACSAVAPSRAEPGRAPPSRAPTGQLALLVGSRSIDEVNDIDAGADEPVDVGDQSAFGLELGSIGASGFGGEVGLFYSSGDDDVSVSGVDVNLELSLLEITFGGRYTLKSAGRFLPYVGAGVDLITWDVSGESDSASASASNTDFGLYVHGGAGFLIGGSLLLGLDLRSVFGTSEGLDYTQAAAFIGFGL